jgi:hypothetical protein
VRLGPVIDLLRRAVAARLDRPGRPGLAGPLIVLIWSRPRAIVAGRDAGLAPAGRFGHSLPMPRETAPR